MKLRKLQCVFLATCGLLSTAGLSLITSCSCKTPKVDETLGQLLFDHDGDGYKVVGLSNTDKTKITRIEVPSTHDGKSVTKIAKGAFKGCGNITSISLPFIGTGSSNSNVDQMFGVIFGDEVFDGCSTYTWQFCENTTSGVPDYAKYAIPNSLVNVTITSGEAIPSGAFSSCKNIETITLSNTIITNKIGSYAFYGCSSLENFDFGFNGRIEEIGDYAFTNCYSLQTIQLTNKTKKIGSGAFANCLSASKAYLPTSVESAGSASFTNLPSILMLENSESFVKGKISSGNWKADWCDETTPIVYDFTNESYQYKDNFMILTCGSGDNRYGYVAQWMGSWQQQTMTIPGSYELDGKTLPIKVVGSSIFSGNISMNKLVVSDGIEKISPSAFEYCTNLNSVLFPDSLTTISANAFIGCINLKSSYKDGQLINKIDFNKVETIGPKAFYGCSNIREINLATVKTIDKEAFAYCTHLCPDNTTEEDNCLLIPSTVTKLGEGAFKWCMKYVPDGVQKTPYNPTIKFGTGTTLTEIPNNCFENSGVRVTRPTSGPDAGTIYPSQIRINVDLNDAPLTRIGDYAFNNMWMGKLQNARHTKLTYIGDYSFYYTQPTSDPSTTTGAQSLQIDQECEYIGDWAFGYCSTIKELKFLTVDDAGVEKNENSLKHLGQYAFYGCSNNDFSEVDLSVCKYLTNYTKGDSEGEYKLENTPRYAFAQCTNLITVTLPTSATFTRIPERMFEGCTKLGMGSSITLPSNINEIRTCAFNGCQYLKHAYIDGTIQYYGSSIFNNNYKLETVTKTGGGDVQFIENLNRNNIGSNQYYNCHCLTKAPIPTTTTTSDYYYNIPSSAFYNCKKLEKIDVSSKNIYSIGSYAFYGCELLNDFKFSNYRTDKSIGERAFAGCTKLGTTNDFVLPEKIIYMGTKVFEGWDVTNQKVYFNKNNVKNSASWDEQSDFTLWGTDSWTFVYHNDTTPYWTCSSCGTDNLKFYLKA